MKEEQVYNIEFKDILKAIKRKFYLVILIAIPAILVSIYYYKVNKDQPYYEVSASLIIGNSLDKAGKQFQISEVSQIQSCMSTYSAIAKTTAVSEKTIQKMGLKISPSSLKSCIAAVPQPETPFMELRLIWTNPQEAIDILDTLTKVYIEEAKNIYPTYNIKVLEMGKDPRVILAADRKIYIVFGLLGGIVASLLLIFALEFMDNTLKTAEDTEACLGIPVIGVIPKRKKKVRAINSITIAKLGYAFMEAYRMLRTNIYNTTIYDCEGIPAAAAPVSGDVHTLVITSGAPGEGKSTIASMMAVVMAQDGKKTILVDCNLRKPGIHSMFNLAQTGITDIVTEGLEWKEIVHKSDIENLYILPAGFRPSNPAELLSLTKMHELIEALKKEFDYIILDTPPIGLVTDAQILSEVSDGYLLVVLSGVSKRDQAMKARKLIQYAGGRCLGALLNKDKDTTGYHYYKYYRK